jgi:DnaK suppressor protein
MDTEDRKVLEIKIVDAIEEEKKLIKSLKETSKPVAPDNAIGRLTRMEAINSKSISEASLNSAKSKLVKLEIALKKIDDPDFGVCVNCENPIPHGRVMLMPESTLCVPCAERKK